MLRTAWRDDPASFHGEHYDFDDIRVVPKPAHDIAIWVGGSSERAYRRGVELGDGYQIIGVTPEEAQPVIARLRRDRPEDTFTISLRTGWDPQGMDPDRIREEHVAFAEAGVQHVVSAPWRSYARRLAAMRWTCSPNSSADQSARSDQSNSAGASSLGPTCLSSHVFIGLVSRQTCTIRRARPSSRAISASRTRGPRAAPSAAADRCGDDRSDTRVGRVFSASREARSYFFAVSARDHLLERGPGARIGDRDAPTLELIGLEVVVPGADVQAFGTDRQ